jgi:hypothetical protein
MMKDTTARADDAPTPESRATQVGPIRSRADELLRLGRLQRQARLYSAQGVGRGNDFRMMRAERLRQAAGAECARVAAASTATQTKARG